jgi:hypothetical protein
MPLLLSVRKKRPPKEKANPCSLFGVSVGIFISGMLEVNFHAS